MHQKNTTFTAKTKKKLNRIYAIQIFESYTNNKFANMYIHISIYINTSISV